VSLPVGTVRAVICLACTGPAAAAMCPECAASLRPAADRVLPRGVAVHSAFVHEGAARRLVHRLKYHPITGVAEFLAGAMAPRVTGSFDAIVPLPRAGLRRWSSGRDPAADLTGALGAILGIEVVPALCAPLWWPRHAGSARRARRAIAFRMAAPIPRRVLVVDDVFTTGATARSAISALPTGRSVLVLTATAAGRVSGG